MSEVIQSELGNTDVEDTQGLYMSDLEALGLTQKDMAAYVRWTMGELASPPDGVSRLMVNLTNKLAVGLGLNIVGNLGRQARLVQFLEEMERVIYDSERIPEMTDEERMSIYKEARNTLHSLQEFQRKYIVQNKNVRPENSEQEKLLSRIMSLPKDKLVQIVTILDGGVEEPRLVSDVLEEALESEVLDID